MIPSLPHRLARAGRRSWVAILALAVWLLLPRVALAIETVAVLDLDGYGIPWETTQVMTQGVRDGFLEEATFDPLSGYDIAEGLSMGQGDALRRSRELLAGARQKMDAGDNAGALRELAEVLSLHENAWSWVARRPELADAHFFTAVALARLGRTTEAVDHLVECVYLYPGYAKDRAVDVPANMSSMFESALRQLEESERRTVPGSRIATIGERLSARYVVTGYVVADGTVHVGLYQDGRLVTEVNDYADELPLYPGDPFFLDLASRLVGGQSSPAPAPTLGTRHSPDGEEDLDDFHEIPVVEPTVTPVGPAASIGTSDGGHLTDQGSSYSHNQRRRRTGRDGHKVSGIHYDRKPVTETWWFWTGLTAVVAGGGVGLYFLLQDDTTPSQQTVENDSYTLTVDPSGIAAQ
ncbi:MAG: tetratricopeptide repeat protein [Pseudomonadota bacterium]